MKNRNKFLAMLFLCASMGLAACSLPGGNGGPSGQGGSGGESSQKQNSRDPQIEAIYNLYAERAQAAGQEPLSYEEWLASIKGEKGDPGQNGQDGHSPVVAINSDGYWTIDGVSTGVKATGSPGAVGQQGKDGTSLLIGDGAPSTNLGLLGDSYIDSNTWDFYYKTQNGWQKLGNIKGADGATGSTGAGGQNGQDGNSVKTGSGAPDALLGETGDSYIDTDTWNFYSKTANGWQLVGNIKGADGQNGSSGQNGKTAWSNTILPSQHGYVTVNVGSALVGTQIVFTAYPDEDYYLSELELNGISVIGDVVNNTYTTEMVENGFVVRAVFSLGEVPAHVHEFGDYQHNDQQHWKECSCGEISSKGDHEFGEWTTDVQPTESSVGHKYRTCSVCNYQQEEDIPALEHVHTSNNTWLSNDTGHYHVCTGCGEIIDLASHDFVEIDRQEPTVSVDGYYTEQCRVCGFERQIAIPASGRNIKIMATNDIHGQIYEEYGVDGDGVQYVERAGADKYMTFLKNKKEQYNALLIDQGDTWQGSVYSNYNHGGLLTDLMNYVQFDSRTIGNHDFDWGVDPVEENAQKDFNGYTTPSLAANIYDYDFDTKTEGDVQQSQLGVPSVTYTVNDVKVGIIGTIGSSQITSICTNSVKDICFKRHIPIIKTEAERLRNEEDCDVVILSHHGGQEDLLNENLNQFIDLALCAHTHKYEYTQEGSLVYVQGRSNNRVVWEINMTYNISTQRLENTPSYMAVTANYISGTISDVEVDPTISRLISQNYEDCKVAEPLVDQNVANNVTGTFREKPELANLMADAIFEEAKAEGYDIYCSYTNTARHDLESGTWTYNQVFEAFPFENDIYIMDVTAAEVVEEIANWNYLRKDMDKWPSEFDVYDNNKTYRIAVIDFLGAHSDSNRNYDYFASCNGEPVATLSKKYRQIFLDYLHNHGFDTGTALSPADYASSLPQFEQSGCAPTKACELTFMYNYGEEGVYQVVNARQGQPFSNFYPASPERDGYVFAGWYFDAACSQLAGGKVKNDTTLYAKWEAGSFYSFDFRLSNLSNGSGGYYYGNQSFTVAASNGNESINVTVDFTDAKYKAEYDEFGMAQGTGMLITLPEGYVIAGYSIDAYYDNFDLYSNATREIYYPFGSKSEGSNHRFTYQGSGLNYQTLYIYNHYSGNGFLYSAHFNIKQTNYAPAQAGSLPNSGYGFRFLDETFIQATYANNENGFNQYLIENRSFTAGQTFQLYDFENTAGWVVDIDVYSFGGNPDDVKWSNYLSNDGTKYTVLQNFNVSAVYIKLKQGQDQLYFQLA